MSGEGVVLRRLGWILIALLVGCQWAPRDVLLPPPGEMPVLPEAGARLYKVNDTASVVTLKVYREGMLARLGHNHVISATRISGTVFLQDPLWRSGARLLIPVRDLVVDRPADRRAAGRDFAGAIEPKAVEATRRNMLSDLLLDAEAHPFIELRVAGLRGDPPNVTLVARVKVRGRVSDLSIPAHLEVTPFRIKLMGSLSLSQRQLGLEPFSVLSGNLRVRDAVDVDFYLIADRR